MLAIFCTASVHLRYKLLADACFTYLLFLSAQCTSGSLFIPHLQLVYYNKIQCWNHHCILLCLIKESQCFSLFLLQDAGVHSKTWYAADCDRKTAEDALYRSNKVKQIVHIHSLILLGTI